MESLQQLPTEVQEAILRLYKAVYQDCEETIFKCRADVESMAECAWDSDEVRVAAEQLNEAIAQEFVDHKQGIR